MCDINFQMEISSFYYNLFGEIKNDSLSSKCITVQETSTYFCELSRQTDENETD